MENDGHHPSHLAPETILDINMTSNIVPYRIPMQRTSPLDISHSHINLFRTRTCGKRSLSFSIFTLNDCLGICTADLRVAGWYSESGWYNRDIAYYCSLSLAVGIASEVAGGLVLLLLLLQIVSDSNDVSIQNTEHTLSTWPFESA